MSLRPLLYHVFPKPLPYLPALALQEKIHSIQARSRNTLPSLEKEALASPSSQATLKQSRHPDVLLLLEHRPVYTAGRRQNAQELEDERLRLERSGADWVATQRGGETTYHGPGQIVGYPLFDLPRMGIRTRDHVCKTQILLKKYIQHHHGIEPFESEHTGVFVSKDRKIASIGMQVRHGLTSHGFAINISDEPLPWFNQVIACGLADVRAASVEGVKGKTGGEMEKNLEEVEKLDAAVREGGLDIHTEMKELAKLYGESYKREIQPLTEIEKEGDVKEIWEAIKEIEEIAERAGGWHKKPLRSVV